MDADPELTRRERLAYVALSIFVAVTRIPAISRTLWDWDEALFALALRDYDVTRHHPHPPGFPLFIALAKLVPLDPFHAVQFVTVVASLFIFPAMFHFAREVMGPPPSSAADATASSLSRRDAGSPMAAALLLAFFPNVWFFGGTAFSDVPSMVLALAACTLLLRGRRADRARLAGALVLGIAAGMRPQNLLIGFVPFLLAFLARRRTAIAGAVLLVIIVAASYGVAAHLSGGWSAYREAVTHHEQFIRNTDSFLAPLHPGLLKVADDFFFWPYRMPVLNVAVLVLAIIGVVRWRPWLVLAIYVPFLLFAWLFLDFHSASRFSIGYMPLYALLAAYGIPQRFRVATVAALVATMIVWTWPALRVVHGTKSPPVAAIEALPSNAVVYVDTRLAAHVELLLPRRTRRPIDSAPPANVWLLREGPSIAPGARTFARDRDRLAHIARDRYFEVSIVPGHGAALHGGTIEWIELAR